MFESALALERATNGVRDFAGAIAAYAELCDDGKGDLRGCERLLRAILNARGTTADGARAARLAMAMCERDHVLGCVLRGVLYREVELTAADEAKMKPRTERIAHACDAGDAGACEGGVYVMAMLGVFAEDDQKRAKAIKACKLDVIAGCRQALPELDGCRSQPAAESCVGGLVARWTDTSSTFAAELDAFARLTRMCDQGDVDACAAIPSRELDPAQLCAASDYGACAKLGCLGDARAAKLGRDHGVRMSCQTLLEQPLTPAAAPPPPPPPST